MSLKGINLGIVGLGYVGLPLAVEFGSKMEVIGYDTNKERIEELEKGEDRTLEVSSAVLRDASSLIFTNILEDLSDCNCFIITVPTPIDEENKPDFNPLLSATEAIGSILKVNDLVIYESTVYPGATEEICIPLLEENSKLKFNKDFFVGYSPERINPGDKEHTLKNIVKVTSGSTPETAQIVDDLYGSIIDAGTYRATSIKVAEAAKVIENTQRDINISLINELAQIFHKLDIDTEEVLLAAGTKWNFLPFRPGLVGGHCIGVDPYYLTFKAKEVGYDPEIILAGRKLNDSMADYVGDHLISEMRQNEIEVEGSNILIMGLTFKENCPDLRNTKVVDLVTKLRNEKANVDCYDPWVDVSEAEQEYRIKCISSPEIDKYDAIVLTVSHTVFKEMGVSKIRGFGKKKSLIYDLKYIFPSEFIDLRL